MGLLQKQETPQAEKNVLRWILESAGPLYGIMIFGILCICIFLSHIEFGRDFLCRNCISAAVLIPIGCFFAAGLFAFSEQFPTRLKRDGKLMLLAASVLLLFIQIYAAWNYYFITDWDVMRIINLSDAVVHGRDLSEFSFYFSRCPNNLFISFIFTCITRFVHFIGFHDYEYFGLICFQCIINTLTGAVLAFVIQERLKDFRFSVFGYLLYVLLVGFSPWVVVPYTDVTGLIFPILIYAIYLKRHSMKNRILPWFFIAFLSGVGYYIKPHALILTIAIVFVEFLNRFPRIFTRRILKPLAAIGSGAVLGLALSQLAIVSMGVTIDHELMFDIPHFFMEGMNDYDMGDYSEEDVTYSGSFNTLAERNQANLKRAFYRIKTMGFIGTMKLMVRKTLTNYYDGTFAWGTEGVFFKEVLEEKATPLCSFFRSLFYTRDYASVGKHYALWANFQQMIWFTILLISAFSAYGKCDPEKAVAFFGVIGITVFELIFEARSRYLYTFLPFYVLLAVYGARSVHLLLQSRNVREKS